MYKLILIIILSIFCFSAAYSQKRCITVNIGAGFSKPDLRYDVLIEKCGLGSINTANSNHHFSDIDYYINATKTFSIMRGIDLNVGIGYALLVAKPRLVINNDYFALGNKALLISRYYEIHKLQLPISFQYNIYHYKNTKLKLAIGGLYNTVFLKRIDPDVKKISKWLFDPQSIEGFGGLMLQQKYIEYQLDCRFFNGKFRDDALANNGKTFDLHNPFKLRFSVGYRF